MRTASALPSSCALPWLGWIPDELTACPAAAVDRLADGLGIGGSERTELLSSYGGWEGRTWRDHRAQVLNRLGWRVSGTGDRKLLDEFLLARALEHDAPGVLLQLACDWLTTTGSCSGCIAWPRAPAAWYIVLNSA